MSYFDATSPPGTEAVKLGAQRIREMKTALNTLIATLWTDAAVFLTNVLPATALTNNSITSSQLANNSVVTAAITDANVTAAKLASDSVTTVKVLDANITAAKLDEPARKDLHQYYSCSGGSSSLYTVNLSPAATSYAAGMVIRFRADVACAALPSVKVNALANKVLVRGPLATGSIGFRAGEIAAFDIIEAVYEAGSDVFVVIGKPPLFESAEQTVAVGATTVAHALGGVPTVVRWVLVCKTTEAGFAVGDEVDVAGTDFGGNVAISFGANSTNAFLSAISAAPVILNKTTGARTSITAANWRYKCYAKM